MAVTDVVTDLASAITFVLAGFVAVNVALYLAQKLIRNTSAFDITLWSLAISVVIYGMDLGIVLLLETLKVSSSGAIAPYFPAISLGLSIPVGILTAAILLSDVAGGIRNRLHKLAGTEAWVGPVSSVWDRVFSNTKTAWIFVHTSDGKEYYGGLAASSVQGEPREVALRNPSLIIRDSQGQITDKVVLGEEMVVLEADLRRVVFFEKK
jgi:hypothetical protein